MVPNHFGFGGLFFGDDPSPWGELSAEGATPKLRGDPEAPRDNPKAPGATPGDKGLRPGARTKDQ